MRRCCSLAERVLGIASSNDFSTRLPVLGNDELTRLASAINTLLDAVSQSREALQQLNVGLESRVSERTRELERQKSQLQAIMDTMGEGLVYCVDDVITYVNRAFVELLDFPAADLVGKAFAILNAPRDPSLTPVYFRNPQHYVTSFARRDGSRVEVAITSTPVDESDAHRRRVIIVRDITQEQAIKAQKDYFFARASHDLRSPLTSLMTRLYMLGKRPDQLEHHLKSLNQVSNQMLELVNDLLVVSSVEQGALSLKQRDLVLQSVVDEVIEVMAADADLKHIDLCAEMVETPLHIYADPLRLNQMITNLVSNAIHYTPEGGAVRVKVDQQDAPPCAVVRVCDTGIGIDPQALPHIFEPFYRVNHDNGGGSGLGLSIVKEIVDLHEGDVSVSSEMGAGTTFTVRLALLDQDSPDTP